MQRDSQSKLQRFVSQFADLRRETAGGNGDFASADPSAPRRVQNPERLDKIDVIGERFAHAHDDQIVD